jgi:hypothetical protein
MRGTSILTSLLILLCGSCKEKIYTGDVNCEECYYDKPENADLIIDLTINSQYPQVPIVVYRGNIEDNKVIYVDTAYYTPFYVNVSVDRDYSVKAEYKKGDKTLYAIDGTKLKVMMVSDACDASCYVIEDESLDARIKVEFLNY